MKVKALMQGYYGDMLRYTGDVFDILPRVETDRRGNITTISEEDQFSHEWMERVDGGPTPQQKRKMPEDVIAPPPPPSNPKTPTTATSRVTPPATVGVSTQTPAQTPVGAGTGDRDVI